MGFKRSLYLSVAASAFAACLPRRHLNCVPRPPLPST